MTEPDPPPPAVAGALGSRPPRLGRPSAPEHTGSTGTRVIGLIVLAGFVLVAVLGLVVTSGDVQLGDQVRPIYVHVPTVITAYLLFLVNALGSAVWLWRRSAFWDHVAASAAEVGCVFLGLTLVTGSVWGRAAWGTWWEWDARLTATLVLFLVYLGYLALRSSLEDPRARATRSAVVGLGAVVLIPVVHKSVDWWRSVHAGRTVLGTFDADIEGLQLFTLVLAMVVFVLCGIWMLMHRFRLAVLSDRAGRDRLEDAVRERRAEAAEAARGRESDWDGEVLDAR